MTQTVLNDTFNHISNKEQEMFITIGNNDRLKTQQKTPHGSDQQRQHTTKEHNTWECFTATKGGEVGNCI